MFILLLIAAVVGYLLGSLPFGYLVARSKGVNIFEVGSKNPGATNVRRVLGAGPGNLVLLLDALKGAVAAGWPLLLRWQALGEIRAAGNAVYSTDQGLMLQVGYPAAAVAGLIGALLGHSFSCFTGFKGGKGVATGAGGFLVLFPTGMGIALLIFGLTLALTRFVSLASMLAAVSLPISAWILHASTVLVAASVVVAVFVIVRHRENVSRLLAGTENKIGRKPVAPKP